MPSIGSESVKHSVDKFHYDRSFACMGILQLCGVTRRADA